MFSKHRFEALSDGIFAIAMTLLVLELKIPNDFVPGQLWHILDVEKASWICFGITFFLAARFWILQHSLFAALEEIEPESAMTTMLFLCLVTLLPFTTSVWGRHPGDRDAFFLYCVHQSSLSIILIIQYEIARRRKHLRVDEHSKRLRFDLYRFGGAMALGAATVYFIPLKWVGVLPALSAFSGRFAQDGEDGATKFWHKVHLWFTARRKKPTVKKFEAKQNPSPK